MTAPDKNKENGNAGDHLANERTYLAWVRTSNSIIAFGIAILKFSVFDDSSKETNSILL